MKIGFLEIKIVKSESLQNDKGTLVVTGNCSDEKLKAFETHCKENELKVIATNLPVLGVFNLDSPIPLDGTKK